MGMMLAEQWESMANTVIIAGLAYAGLVLLLRVSGKRTLTKMNAFDFVVTVALGSTLATTLLSDTVSLAEGLIGLGMLIGLQLLITWAGTRHRWVRRLVTGDPSLLLYRGQFLPRGLQRSRISRDEVRAAVRGVGLPALTDAHAVILETNGSLSVIRADGQAPAERSSLEGVMVWTVDGQREIGSEPDLELPLEAEEPVSPSDAPPPRP
jgi:uncharacterized membrane protein YcaP (DUF421 family)